MHAKQTHLDARSHAFMYVCSSTFCVLLLRNCQVLAMSACKVCHYLCPGRTLRFLSSILVLVLDLEKGLCLEMKQTGAATGLATYLRPKRSYSWTHLAVPKQEALCPSTPISVKPLSPRAVSPCCLTTFKTLKPKTRNPKPVNPKRASQNQASRRCSPAVASKPQHSEPLVQRFSMVQRSDSDL